MIVVKIEMYPGGDKTKKYPLGVIIITNDGTGTAKEGNYDVALSHAGVYVNRKGIWKKGKVRGFPRKLSPYHLLARALRAAGVSSV